MVWWGKNINNNYAWEISLFHRYRFLSDGISFCEININWDRYLADHTPRFDLLIVIFNVALIDFSNDLLL